MYCRLIFYAASMDIQISTPEVNLEERAEALRKGFADLVENVVSVSREEYEQNTEEEDEED